ncbi:anaerobic ribonucleoside-triphosphate reductase activating protein [Oscillospiraceae bacterium 50-58]
MNYADIKKVDVANGPGVRVSLFVSGCTHRCEACFNPETWDFSYGSPFGEEEIEKILALLAPDHIRGLSLLGGEPFEPDNQSAVLDLVRRVRKELPGKSIWCYSGYLFEELADGKVGEHSRELLEGLDVLVDGPFVLAKKDLGLRFRGSSNQRIIDVPVSLETREVRLAEEYMQ